MFVESFLNASEFEKLFMQKWGGFSGACNFIHPDASTIYLRYEFDKNVVRNVDDTFTNDNYHIEFTIRKIGNSYDILVGDTTLEVADQLLKGIEIYDNFDTTFESPIRQLSPYYSEVNLLSDGKNLTGLLSYLNGNSVKAFDKLVEEFKKINPNFRELVFTTPIAGKSLLSLKEKKLR
jgi:predicted ATPase